MVENKVKDRLEFLAEKFDIFECESEKDIDIKKEELIKNGFDVNEIKADDKLLCLLSINKNEDKVQKSVSVSFDIFSDMIAADPTPNKSCVQWMLTVFTRYIKVGGQNINNAIRFAVEDLPQANSYIQIFEANKRKKKFKDFCKAAWLLKNVKDPTDINQYHSLSQLFDAVDPFIEKNPTELGSLLEKFVDIGEAEIPFKDRKFTLYIPKTLNASVVFDKFANWCTAKPNNGMFAHYTNYLTPDNKKSKLYIIINNDFFLGKSQEIYQIHFQTNQIKDRYNNNDVSIFETVLLESEGLSKFFYDELMGMAKKLNAGLENNKYLDFLIRFGFCESLFELIDENTPIIRFMTREVPRLPDVSKFKSLDQLVITNAKMVELHPSIGNLKNLEMLVLTNNSIKSLPSEIGNLKNLTFINITGNKNIEIPNEIKYLDKSNGGSLFRIAVRENEIGEKNYKRLKELLPTTNF